ncbi:MAG: hypothetical protein R2932_33610 [Caldilineaceae bacterium]
MGRNHPRFAVLVDLWIFIDTPLDVAMARRILWDHTAPSVILASDRLQALREKMIHYLTKALSISGGV